MKFNILNRWSGEVRFTAEIDCAEDAPTSIKIGLSVKWAYERGADLTRAVLTRADLRGAVLTRADLRGADLRGAVLTGAVLTRADLRGADLTRADLTRAVLTGADLGAVLRGAVLRGADLRGADLRGAVLTGADLTRADLRGTDAPVIENIDAKILAAIEASIAAGKPGIDMDSWHTCKTTHCRAGWAITLAGKAGAELEKQCGAHLAGILIYRASRPGQPIPDFFATNDEALADLRKCAAQQTGESSQ